LTRAGTLMFSIELWSGKCFSFISGELSHSGTFCSLHD
jgi:hypothetical protein